MLPVADIATPGRMRRLGAIWFILPLLLVGVWLIAAPHHPAHSLRTAAAGVAVER